jgi:hypothetical protein
MIKCLKDYEPAEVEGILSTLTLALLPSPDERPVGNWQPIDAALQEQIVREVKTTLQIKDQSPKSEARFFEFLSGELARAALANSNTETIKERIGQSGLLKKSLYHIEFTQEFKRDFLSMGVRPNQVEDTIQDADKFEHFFQHEKDDVSFSIFMKAHDDFKSLVIAKRKGYHLIPKAAWKVYPAKVSCEGLRSPIAILRAFAEHYGVEFTLRGHETGKFFVSVEFPFGEGDEAEQNLIEFPIVKDQHVAGEILFKKDDQAKKWQVGFAYFVNLNRYLHDIGVSPEEYEQKRSRPVRK